MKLLEVLVVDDSFHRRQQLTELIESTRLARVIGSAQNGVEALQQAKRLNPDLITLDLEMPGIDGFGFLRLVMNSLPIPVIVVSSNNRRDAVFKALELGAIDFITAPEGRLDDEAQEAISRKLLSIRAVRSEHLRKPLPQLPEVPPEKSLQPAGYRRPKRIVAIAASTGGPTALTQIMSKLPAKLNAAVVISQHMPATFTGPFAERLNRYCPLDVHEAMDGEPLAVGQVLVCPGNRCLELVDDGKLRVSLQHPRVNERYVPSADRMLASVAKIAREGSIGVVLTGMGDDGAAGALEIERMGGRLVVESEATAVVYGMPRVALLNVPNGKSVRLEDVALEIERIVHSR